MNYILFIFIGLMFSFFFAGFETGFLSLDYLIITYYADIKNQFIYKRLKKFYLKKELVLSTILIGNNLSIIISTIIFNLFTHEHLIGFKHFELLQVILSVGFISPLFFVFGEIIPKLLFRTYPYKLIKFFYPLFELIHILLFPFTLFLYFLSKLVLRLINHFGNNKTEHKHLEIFSSIFKRNSIEKIINIENNIFDMFEKIEDVQIYNYKQKVSNILDEYKKNRFNIIFIEKDGVVIGYSNIDDLKNCNKNVKIESVYKRVVLLDKNKKDITNDLKILNKINYGEVLVKQERNNYFYLDKKIFFLNLF